MKREFFHEERVQDSRSLVYGSSDAAFLLDTKGSIVAWNEGAQTLLGYGAEEAVGEPCWRVLHGVTATGDPVCTPACAAISCFHRGVPFGVPEIHIRHKDGHTFPVTLSTLLLPRDEVTGARGAVALIFLRPTTVLAETLKTDSLRLYCLGPLRLLRGIEALDWWSWRRKQAVTLLAFLAHHRGKPVHRELIMETLWPEAPLEAAGERLKVVVYGLRRGLGDTKGTFVVRQGASYLLDPIAVWMDVVAFEELLTRGLRLAENGGSEEGLVVLEAAQALYRGGYLEEERYNDWAQLERYRLAERYLDLLRAMGIVHARQGRHREAVRVYRLALAQDPCREDLHRLLIRALSALGERTQALQQFQQCEEVLRTQLGVAPSSKTVALRDAILVGSLAPMS